MGQIMRKTRLITTISATYGLFAVVLGAFGAHALEARLEASGTHEVWKTAVDYQMWHALALLFLAIAPVQSRATEWAAGCFCLGVALFSGSLYGLALDGPRWLGPVTPLGGLSLTIGWALLILAAVRSSDE